MPSIIAPIVLAFENYAVLPLLFSLCLLELWVNYCSFQTEKPYLRAGRVFDVALDSIDFILPPIFLWKSYRLLAVASISESEVELIGSMISFYRTSFWGGYSSSSSSKSDSVVNLLELEDELSVPLDEFFVI